MNNLIQMRMLNSAYACLLPLAKLLLRAGITYRQFDSIAKRAFVREAMAEADARGRPTNTSRIAVMTGLSRKDVKRIREFLASDPVVASGATADQSGPPSKVLHTWHVDPRFLKRDGSPRDLIFQDEEEGFCALVKAVGGDVPPGAVRTELKRAGAVTELDDGRLRAIKRYYVPGSVDDKAVTVMSGMLFPLAAGIVHNANPDRTADGFIQRFAYSQSLEPDAVTEFRIWSRAQAASLIEAMDDWLAKHESSDRLPSSESEGPIAGIGVFYYEGPTAQGAVDEVPRGGAGKTRDTEGFPSEA
jgi:hypothetical protein